MKNILIIAYFYPPMGGAGVQRSLKFSNYLSDNEYNVYVLTVANGNGTVIDESLRDGTDNIKVFRAKQTGIDIANRIMKNKSKISTETNKLIVGNNNFKYKLKKKMKNVLLNIYRSMYIPDDKISWKKDAVAIGLKIIKDYKIDIIYSTSAPYTSHLVAYKLKKTASIKWIADFRDQWATNPFVKLPYITEKINYYLEKKVVNTADYVISVSKPIVDDFINRYGEENKEKFQVITNGYGEEDFAGYSIGLKSEKFIITYNGSLYGKRSPSNFLKAVENLISNEKISKDNIIIRFVGEVGRDALTEINSFILRYKDIIKMIQYLPHRESIKQLEESSALLLIIEGGPGSEGIFTGKIFEYIRSGRMIIGIVPDGVARDLINETNTGFCSYPDCINEIETAIYKSYLIWSGEMPILKIKWDIVKEYNRENLTKNLIALIEDK